MIYGYVRVSTREQNEARQMKAMSENEVPEKNIYMDKQSGKDGQKTKRRRCDLCEEHRPAGAQL